MSETFDLSESGLVDLKNAFASDENFSAIAWPRLRLIEALKNKLAVGDALSWKVKYSPVNSAENCVMISLFDARKKFHFYYVIPLGLRLNVYLFLGDNTFNFFEAYPLLIQKGVIQDDEYRVAATNNTLPHLVLSQKTDRYEVSMLADRKFSDDELQQSALFGMLDGAFKKFNSSLFSIIDGTYQL